MRYPAREEGMVAGEQDVHDDSARPHVHGRPIGPLPPELGRHVVGRPREPVPRRLAVPSCPHSQPEVGDLDRGPFPLPREEQVLGLEVAVDDALTVGVWSIPEDARTPFLFGLSRSADLCESRMRTSYATQPVFSCP